MWSIAIALSWQAEQAATIGELTSVVLCALHGAASEQVATTPVQGSAVVHVHGVVALQAFPKHRRYKNEFPRERL